MTETQEVSPFAGSPAPPGAVDYGKFSFSVKRFVLLNLCEHAAVAVSTGIEKTRPDLASFQVRLGGGVDLQVAATDMERTVITASPAVAWDQTAPAARFHIPARRLLTMLRESPEGDVEVTVTKNKAEVSVPGASWKLVLPDSIAYPQLPEPSSFDFSLYSRDKLLAALRAVRHAICRDASRPNLTQVQFSSSAVTASDGSRLARAELPGFPMTACVPAPAVDDLVRLLIASPVDDIEAGQSEELVAFRAGHVILAATKRHMAFPDVDNQLIKPAEANEESVTAEKKELDGAIRRVRINADTATAAIGLWVSPEQVAVVSRDKTGNSAREAVNAKWDAKVTADPAATERLVVVNHVHLSEAIEAHPGTQCEFLLGKDVGKKRSMVLLRGEGMVQVLSQMPPALVGY